MACRARPCCSRSCLNRMARSNCCAASRGCLPMLPPYRYFRSMTSTSSSTRCGLRANAPLYRYHACCGTSRIPRGSAHRSWSWSGPMARPRPTCRPMCSTPGCCVQALNNRCSCRIPRSRHSCDCTRSSSPTRTANCSTPHGTAPRRCGGMSRRSESITPGSVPMAFVIHLSRMRSNGWTPTGRARKAPRCLAGAMPASATSCSATSSRARCSTGRWPPPARASSTSAG